MARWDPDSRTRLQEAAVALIAERGFDAVTAAEIAERAGVTERTFFRHFGDKREAVFANEDAMQAALAGGVAGAPADAAPGTLVAAGLAAAAAFLEPRRDGQRTRFALVDTHPALRERELAKQETTAAVLADALVARGVAPAAAALAGRVGIAVLGTAFERWIAAGETRPLAALVDEALADLGTLHVP